MASIFEDSIDPKRLCPYISLYKVPASPSYRDFFVHLISLTSLLTHITSHCHSSIFIQITRPVKVFLLIMKITQVYAIVMAGLFLAFVVKSFLHVLVACSTKIRVFLLRHFFYSSLIHRHSLLGPLGRVHALAQLINVAINVFFLSFQASSVSKAGTRAGTLSLINMVPVFAGPHLSFLSNLTGMNLKTHRRLHRSAGIILITLHHKCVHAASVRAYLRMDARGCAIISECLSRLSSYERV